MKRPGDDSSAARSGQEAESQRSTQDTLREAYDTTRDWIVTDRVRLFGSAAAASFVLMVICLFVPHWIFSVLIAGSLALITAVLGLLAVGTWVAARKGAVSNTGDLWDSDNSDTATVEDLLDGFGFSEDGHQDQRPPGR
ncbi:MAG: hypothetical protein U0R64_07125 [Candidatus Nanopelagicales bacterium]